MTQRSNTVSAEHWETLKQQYRSRLRLRAASHEITNPRDGTFGTAAATEHSPE